MTFREAVTNYIEANISLDHPLYYGTGERADGGSYYNLTLVSDLEQPSTYCKQQGEEGQALLQFTFVAGNQTTDSGLGYVSDELEKLKVAVAGIIGDIGNNFQVWENLTNGVSPFGDSDGQIWAALFESNMRWQNDGV
jgi:hypothetical protein